ncbi:Predicted permease [Lachnospiraceae bacterium G11]|nr:Predicted permease [Lachnospiraceae bacterium G11]
MGNLIVVEQMLIIFALIMVGFFLYKRGHLSDETSKQLSWIVVNITNSITLLCAALKDENKVGIEEIGVAFACFAFVYGVLIMVGLVLPALIGVPKEDRYSYRMLATFNNVGFIGIPFCAAVLGTSSLIFVSICGIVFNLIAYTYGAGVLRKVAASGAGTLGLRKAINSGTVMGIVTIVVYIMNLKVPEAVGAALSHVGSCTTFLSMAVLGVSVAKMVPREVFGRWRLYIFVILRQILVPILIIMILKPFIGNELIIKTVAVLLAMPSANLPLMMAKQLGVRDDTISAGIILTTLAAVVTIPIIMKFC